MCKNSPLYLRENGMVKIPDARRCLNFLSNVPLRLDYRKYTPISFERLKKDFHCEATYKPILYNE